MHRRCFIEFGCRGDICPWDCAWFRHELGIFTGRTASAQILSLGQVCLGNRRLRPCLRPVILSTKLKRICSFHLDGVAWKISIRRFAHAHGFCQRSLRTQLFSFGWVCLGNLGGLLGKFPFATKLERAFFHGFRFASKKCQSNNARVGGV